MKHILTIISTALLILAPCALSAQQTNAPTSLTGVVSDDLGPLFGATVTWENKDGRTIGGGSTDMNGTYNIAVPVGQTDLKISVSFVGYKTQVFDYTGQTRLNVTLEQDAITLNAAEAVAQRSEDMTDAFGQDRETIGYATETIDISQFQEMAVVSVEDMLVGKIAGLDIIGEGDPGTLSTIRIRGTSSLNANNQPLFVIDGVPQDITTDSDFNFGDATVEDFGTLVNISPNDIQNIEVLKDAAAVALWGDQAANGVLVITTKQGGEHTPFFSVSEKVSVTMKPEKFRLLNGSQYKVLMQDAMWNWIRDGEFAADRVNTLNNQKDILYDQDYNYFREYNQNTDWLDLVTQEAINNDTDFSMSGGGNKATYRFSLSYHNSTSSTVGADFERITSRLNVTYKFSNKFRVTSNFHYEESTRNQAYENSGDGIDPPRQIALKKMPNMSPWVLDSEGNPTDEYFTAPDNSVLQSSMPNPLALVEESENRLYARSIGASFSTRYDLFRGFNASATVAFDMRTQRRNQYLPQSAVNVTWSDSKYNRGVESLNSNSKTYINLQTRYIVPLPKNHRLNLSLGEQITAETSNSYSMTTSGNGTREVSLPSSGGKVTNMSSGRGIYRSIGVVGVASYTFRDKYSITFSGRVNANSNNALGSKWGKLNPAMNWRWNMEKEPWIKKISWIDRLNIKGSWGRTERRQDLTKTTGTYAESGYYAEDIWVSIQPQQMQLYNLSPEIVTSSDFSIGGELFDGRIIFDLHYYQSQTKDLYQENQGIPSSTGFSTVRIYNSGKVENKGFDGSVSLPNIIRFNKKGKNPVNISFNNINFARNRNRMLELPSGLATEESFTLGNGNVAKKAIAGTPIGSIYGFEFVGIYQDYQDTYARDQYGKIITDLDGKPVTTKVGGNFTMRAGDVWYKDQNYDGNIDESDLIYLGNSYPSIIGGATLQVRWKDLMFRTSFAMRLGHDVYNKARLNSEQMSDANNQSTNALARWRYKGEITEIPRALWGSNRNSLVSDLYVEDASFFKIKDVTLSYSLPREFVRKLGLTRANVFFNAYNILTFTKYTGVDPEITFGSGRFDIATDNSKTPPARRFALGLSFDF